MYYMVSALWSKKFLLLVFKTFHHSTLNIDAVLFDKLCSKISQHIKLQVKVLIGGRRLEIR